MTPCVAVSLAGIAATNDVNGLEVMDSAFADVSESFCIGKVSCKDSPAIFIDLYLPDSFDSCPLETQVKAANTGKQ
jgi:hypothetical protein